MRDARNAAQAQGGVIKSDKWRLVDFRRHFLCMLPQVAAYHNLWVA
jgi:hypothetical protein